MDTRKKLMARYALASMLGDEELAQDVVGKVQSWNAKHPDLAVKQQDLVGAANRARKTQQNASTYGVISAKKPRESVLDAVN